MLAGGSAAVRTGGLWHPLVQECAGARLPCRGAGGLPEPSHCGQVLRLQGKLGGRLDRGRHWHDTLFYWRMCFFISCIHGSYLLCIDINFF